MLGLNIRVITFKFFTTYVLISFFFFFSFIFFSFDELVLYKMAVPLCCCVYSIKGDVHKKLHQVVVRITRSVNKKKLTVYYWKYITT